MTRDEIIAMAADAGFGTLLPAEMAGSTLLPATWVGADQRKLERFAALVAAKEREACALVAEDDDHEVSVRGYYAQLGDARATMRNVAAAIRARSNTTT